MGGGPPLPIMPHDITLDALLPMAARESSARQRRPDSALITSRPPMRSRRDLRRAPTTTDHHPAPAAQVPVDVASAGIATSRPRFQ